MDYVRLGNTGVQGWCLCLGCMGFGDPDRWIHAWVLREAESRPVIRRAVELGITFFDTANVYPSGPARRSSAGRSETSPLGTKS